MHALPQEFQELYEEGHKLENDALMLFDEWPMRKDARRLELGDVGHDFVGRVNTLVRTIRQWFTALNSEVLPHTVYEKKDLTYHLTRIEKHLEHPNYQAEPQIQKAVIAAAFKSALAFIESIPASSTTTQPPEQPQQGERSAYPNSLNSERQGGIGNSGPTETLQEWAKAGVSKVTLALLFTDIVNSSAIGSELGDDKWIEVLMRHFKRARALAERFDCYVIKVVGDSFMVAFRTAYDALKFAMEFYEETGDPLIKIRAGIHLGQVRIIDNDIYGRMVNYTSRVEHSMEGSGIALSSFAYEDVKNELGSQNTTILFKVFSAEMKGFPSPQFLHRVLTADVRAANRERYELLTGSEVEADVSRLSLESDKFSDHDRKLFNQFIDDFPSQGRSAIFLRDHDIGGSFRESDLGDIYNFLRAWNDAEHEFNKAEMERKRKALWDALDLFCRELGQHTFLKREGWLSIGVKDFEDRQEMIELQEKLNGLGTTAYQAHQDLIREGKRHL